VESLIRTEYFGGSSGYAKYLPSACWALFSIRTQAYYYLVWSIVAVAVLVCLRICETALGRSMKAVHTDEDAAGSMGFNVAKTKLQAFVFSAALAAVAGSLYAHYATVIAPGSFNIMVSVKLLLMLYLGGSGTIYGGLLGAFILFALPEWLEHLERFELALEGIIFMVILIFLPGGLVGGLGKLSGLSRAIYSAGKKGKRNSQH